MESLGGPRDLGVRILIVGSGGAGKSTLARGLADITSLPLVHLDQHYWRPGWRRTPTVEWRGPVQSLLVAPMWIMDGNYGGTLDLRVPRATLIVFLDLPRRTALAGAVRRRLRWPGRARQDLIPGCPGRLMGVSPMALEVPA